MNGGADERVEDDGERLFVYLRFAFLFLHRHKAQTHLLFPPFFTLLKLELLYQLLLGKEPHCSHSQCEYVFPTIGSIAPAQRHPISIIV
jgi:hypothetical protein